MHEWFEMDFFVCVGKTNVLMLTLRLRINVQQNPFFWNFPRNKRKESSYLNNYQGLHDYSGLQSTLKYPKKIRNNVHFNFCLQLYNIVSAYLTHKHTYNIMVTHYLLNAIITEQCHEFDTWNTNKLDDDLNRILNFFIQNSSK